MKRKRHHFGDILEANCTNVFKDAMDKLKTIYNYFSDYEYLFCTGGTCDAWKGLLRQVFMDMDDLKIIPYNVLTTRYFPTSDFYGSRLNPVSISKGLSKADD